MIWFIRGQNYILYCFFPINNAKFDYQIVQNCKMYDLIVFFCTESSSQKPSCGINEIECDSILADVEPFECKIMTNSVIR